MSDARVVSIEELRRRLRDTLGHDSLLGRRFDLALRRQDELEIAAAMDVLRLYPEAVRSQVEGVLTGWLLDGADEARKPDLASA